MNIEIAIIRKSIIVVKNVKYYQHSFEKVAMWHRYSFEKIATRYNYSFGKIAIMYHYSFEKVAFFLKMYYYIAKGVVNYA